MKKTVKMLAIVLALMLGLCCSAQAITQSEIEGLWDVDLKPIFVMQGIPEDQIDAFLELIGGMTMTIEFTADRKMVMETTVGAEVSREEYEYLLIGDTVVLSDGTNSVLTRSGDTLTLVDPDGTEMILTKHSASAAAPAASSVADIVGVWSIDVGKMLDMIGIPEEEVAEIKPYLPLMSATMEFTADGRCIIATSLMGEELSHEEASYTVDGDIIALDGAPAQYTLVGDTMTIVEDDLELVLIRKTGN
ncbi:MAG: hypothetical protein E7324_10685 [Clostridiales bacterium]|nr:hypothetical protein [Clostridiales bacterium]